VNSFKPSTTVCRGAAMGADGTTCDQPEMCTGSAADCPADVFLAPGTTCRAKADECDIPETCDGSRFCPGTDVRRDHGYSFKCARDCFVCAVEPEKFVNAKGKSWELGGCNVGACSNFIVLQWPECVSQCINSLCPNNRGLSNAEVFTCDKPTGNWQCDYKLEGSQVAQGVCPYWPDAVGQPLFAEEQSATAQRSASSESSSSSVSIPMLVGSGAGGLVIGAGVATLLACLYFRRRNSSNEYADEEAPHRRKSAVSITPQPEASTAPRSQDSANIRAPPALNFARFGSFSQNVRNPIDHQEESISIRDF
jgi:hypothetical protein